MVADLSSRILPGSIGDTACDARSVSCKGLDQTINH